jgi:hypothetical protein
VALVHRLEESHLGVTGQVYVLSAVSNQLHKSTRHLVLAKKIISDARPRAPRPRT